MDRDDGIGMLADRIRRAARLTVVTGAGVSAASGIPGPAEVVLDRVERVIAGSFRV